MSKAILECKVKSVFMYQYVQDESKYNETSTDRSLLVKNEI